MRNPSIIDALEQFTKVITENGFDSPEYIALDNKFRPFLSQYKELYNYYDIFIISTEGDIIFTVEREDDFKTNLKTGPYKDSELASVFNRSRTLLQTDISEFKYYPPSLEPAAFIATPIYKEGNIIGVVAFQMTTDKLFKLAQDYSDLGMTGEMILASKIDDELIFITPLRFDSEAAFNKKLVLGSEKSLPMQEAIQGKSGFGFSVDYRDKEVLAVWEYLPSLRSGMVVKIDTAEIFAPANELRNRLLVIIIMSILIVIIIAVLVARSISEPIIKLTEGAKKIGDGNLEYKIKIKSQDEIGELATSFNKMADSLSESHRGLEEKVEIRTKEFEQANKMMMGRESRIAELKKENKEFKKTEKKDSVDNSKFYDSNI